MGQMIKRGASQSWVWMDYYVVASRRYDNHPESSPWRHFVIGCFYSQVFPTSMHCWMEMTLSSIRILWNSWYRTKEDPRTLQTCGLRYSTQEASSHRKHADYQDLGVPSSWLCISAIDSCMVASRSATFRRSSNPRICPARVVVDPFLKQQSPLPR